MRFYACIESAISLLGADWLLIAIISSVFSLCQGIGVVFYRRAVFNRVICIYRCDAGSPGLVFCYFSAIRRCKPAIGPFDIFAIFFIIRRRHICDVGNGAFDYFKQVYYFFDSNAGVAFFSVFAVYAGKADWVGIRGLLSQRIWVDRIFYVFDGFYAGPDIFAISSRWHRRTSLISGIVSWLRGLGICP